MPASSATINTEATLIDHITHFVYDPLGFVYYAYPWGSGALKDFEGPDTWQTDILNEIGINALDALDAIQLAVRSGHGIGKTALMAWINHWFISTRPNPQIVVTANTKDQLINKTWRELAKWHKLSVNAHWFNWTATKFYKESDPETWFAVATPWSKERSEAFAGTHEKHVLMLYDEASAIDDVIWEVTEGAMTTPGAMWIAFGNPTRNTGRFSQCFKRYRHRWITREIDSRTAKMANKSQIQKWVDDYGEDSDFVRVRVLGKEPRSGAMQFIGEDIVAAAMGNEIHRSHYNHAPKVLGVDVARFGDDQSVIVKRQGLAAWGLKKFRGLDTMTFSSLVSQEINEWNPDAVFIDEPGIGGAVVDRLRQTNHDVIGINTGRQAGKKNHYYNKRAEMWGDMRDWLDSGAAIPNDNELRDDLTSPEYGFDAKERIQLEKKDDMKTRGIASPDCGDALALTFAMPVYKRREDPIPKKKTYDPWAVLN